MDNQIAELIDPIYRERVMRARTIPASRKMGWGPNLFAESCGRIRSGIRMQFPRATALEVEAILRERLNRLWKLNEVAIFRPVLNHD